MTHFSKHCYFQIERVKSMVLLGREKTKNYRIRNEIRAFINNYYEDIGLGEESLIPVKDFISAKEAEFCALHDVARVEFDQGLVKIFHDRVALVGKELNGEYCYHVAGMLAIWRKLRERE